MAPGGTYQAVIADLDKQTRRSRIALVGHEPGIGELASRLAGSRHPLEFKKGAACGSISTRCRQLVQARCGGFSPRESCEACGNELGLAGQVGRVGLVGQVGLHHLPYSGFGT